MDSRPEAHVKNATKAKQFDVALMDSLLITSGKPGLLNTASGVALAMKHIEYWGEVLAGMFMILSHLAIWYFCEERHIDLAEQLPDPVTIRTPGPFTQIELRRATITARSSS